MHYGQLGAAEEEALHDLVDHRLGPAAAARIAARLGQDPEATARLRAYRAQNAGLAALYGAIAAEPVPPALTALLADAGAVAEAA